MIGRQGVNRPEQPGAKQRRGRLADLEGVFERDRGVCDGENQDERYVQDCILTLAPLPIIESVLLIRPRHCGWNPTGGTTGTSRAKETNETWEALKDIRASLSMDRAGIGAPRIAWHGNDRACNEA